MSRAISSVQASQALTSGGDGQIHHKTQHKLERARVRSRSSEGPPRLVSSRERSQSKIQNPEMAIGNRPRSTNGL